MNAATVKRRRVGSGGEVGLGFGGGARLAWMALGLLLISGLKFEKGMACVSWMAARRKVVRRWWLKCGIMMARD